MRESMPSELRDGTLFLNVATDEGVCTICAAGELDLANAQTLSGALEEASTSGEIVLDMSELEFIDSTGIALLVSMHHRRNRNGAVGFRLIASQSPGVQRVLALTGLDRELPFSVAESRLTQA